MLIHKVGSYERLGLIRKNWTSGNVAERVRRLTFSGKNDPLFYCAKPSFLAQKNDCNNKKRGVETAPKVSFLTRSATYDLQVLRLIAAVPSVQTISRRRSCLTTTTLTSEGDQDSLHCSHTTTSLLMRLPIPIERRGLHPD